MAGPAPAQTHPSKIQSPLTLFQANLRLAMLGGFWARQADGHPGPDLMSRGWVILNVLVAWESIKKESAPKNRPAKEPRRKPGLRATNFNSAEPQLDLPQ